jgi:hypothetical protein
MATTAYLPDYVSEVMRQHETNIWRLYDATGRILINKNDKDISIEDSIELLQECIEKSVGDYVTVKLYTKIPSRKVEGETAEQGLHIKVRLPANRDNTNQGFLNGQPNWKDLIQLNDQKNKLELEKFKLEMETEKPNAWEKIANKLLENDALIIAITGFLSKVSSSPAAATVIAAPKTNIDDNSIQESIQKLSEIDADYQKTLSDMAEYLTKNPSVLPQIKNIVSNGNS